MSEQSKELQVQENRLISAPQIEFANKLSLILQDVENIGKQENFIIQELMFSNAKAEIELILTDEVLKNTYQLFGDSNGVKMDKKYDKSLYKSIAIQAWMQGYSLRGNQINILGGNMYIRAQGYLPKLRKFPNFSFTFPFKHHIPVKDATTFTTTVTTDLEWILNGKFLKKH